MLHRISLGFEWSDKTRQLCWVFNNRIIIFVSPCSFKTVVTNLLQTKSTLKLSLSQTEGLVLVFIFALPNLSLFFFCIKILKTSDPLSCSRSGRSIYLADHHVPASQEHTVALWDDQGAAAGEGEWGIDDSAAEGDAGNPC